LLGKFSPVFVPVTPVTVTVAVALPVPPSPLQLNVNELFAAVRAPVLAEPLVARPPDQAPEAVQLVAFVDDHVSELLPPLLTLVGLAVKATVGTGAELETATVTDLLAVPPSPLQLSVNVLLAAVSAPVLAEPPVARLPDHAPEAVQLVALVDDHVRVEDSPLATLVGFAVSVKVGAGAVVVTVTERLVVPPPPVQVNVNVVFAFSAEVAWLPLVAFEPLHPPEAVQLDALVAVHVRVDDPPLTTEVGLAVRVTAGAFEATFTLAVRLALPPAPVQVSVKLVVAASAPVDWLPLVDFVPFQPPDAVQLEALLELQLSVAEAPLATVDGFADRVTDGGAGGTVTATETVWLTLPPAPEQVIVKSVAALSALLDSVPLVARSPLQPPDAEQFEASVELQVSDVAFPTTTTDGLAASDRVGAGVDPTLTVTVWLAVPPAPVHVSVKPVVVETGSVVWLPLKALSPLQPPDAVQLVAFDVFQVRVAVWPLVTVVGAAVSDSVGATGSATLTVTVRPLAPPVPVQVSVKLVVAFRAGITSLPVNALLPLHPSAAVQAVAFDAFQLSVTAPPGVVVAGLALRVTTGGAPGVPGSIVTFSGLDSPEPAQPQDTEAASSTTASDRIITKILMIISVLGAETGWCRPAGCASSRGGCTKSGRAGYLERSVASTRQISHFETWPGDIEQRQNVLGQGQGGCQARRLDAQQVHQSGDTVLRGPCDDEIGCFLTGADDLRANAGIGGLESDVHHVWPVLADRFLEMLGTGRIDTVVDGRHPLDIRAESYGTVEIQSRVNSKACVVRHRINEMTERPHGARKVVTFRQMGRGNLSERRAFDPLGQGDSVESCRVHEVSGNDHVLVAARANGQLQTASNGADAGGLAVQHD
jgi:hypothetical protein